MALFSISVVLHRQIQSNRGRVIDTEGEHCPPPILYQGLEYLQTLVTTEALEPFFGRYLGAMVFTLSSPCSHF